MNDVKWRAYLVRHILHELRLLFTGLTCQQGGLLQLLSALLGFVLRMFCIADMLADASPHLAEAVLQLSYQVGALTWGEVDSRSSRLQSGAVPLPEVPKAV